MTSQENIEPSDWLTNEKNAISKYINETKKPIDCENSNNNNENKRKDNNVSVQYSMEGTNYVAENKHGLDEHRNALKLYDKSIAYAQNDSHRLALAYRTRMKFYFHMKRYEECMDDCYAALDVSFCTDILKSQMKMSIIDCLVLLKRNNAKDECAKALKDIAELDINEDTKNSTCDLLKKYMNHLVEINFDEIKDNNDEELVKNERSNYDTDIKKTFGFESQDEIPCASKSIMVQYNEEYGRHVTATRDIEPGEIIVVEKSYFTMIDHDDTLADRNCFHCAKSSLRLIPCRCCAFIMYCSEKCRTKDWMTYHRFECDVLPYDWYLKFPIRMFTIRFMLTSVNRAGGIEELKKELARDYQCSVEGFNSDSPRVAYNFVNSEEVKEERARSTVQFSCDAAYYLATRTDFFGRKYDLPYSDVLKIEDVSFVAAVILRSFFTIKGNLFKYYQYQPNFAISEPVGFSFHSFCRFFNHDCCPNAAYLTSKDNEMVVFAKHSIKKGSQITISYLNCNYLAVPKSTRQAYLKSLYFLSCSCMACKKNWTKKNLVTLKMLLEFKPEVLSEIRPKLRQIFLDMLGRKKKSITFVRYILKTMKMFHAKSLARSAEYEILFKVLQTAYVHLYGNSFDEVPALCD